MCVLFVPVCGSVERSFVFYPRELELVSVESECDVERVPERIVVKGTLFFIGCESESEA